MAPAHHLFAGRSRTTPTAHEYWGQDRRRGRLSRSQAPARPSTNDHTDRETARKSSSTPHRSRRCVPDRLSARGERIRVESAAFPCPEKMLRARHVILRPGADPFHGECDENEKSVEDPNT